MPGPGFRSLSPVQHRVISSKGGKATFNKYRMRLKYFKSHTEEQRTLIALRAGKVAAISHRLAAIERIVKPVATPEQKLEAIRLGGANGGKMTALTRKVNRLELKLKELENGRINGAC